MSRASVLLLRIAARLEWRYIGHVLSQGGAKIPTGGNITQLMSADKAFRAVVVKPASASWFYHEGQQIQCNSGADGYSPDGRENNSMTYFDALNCVAMDMYYWLVL